MSIFGFTDNLRDWEDNFRGNIYAQFERAVFGRRPKDIPDQNLAAETGPERIAGGVVSCDVTLRHKGASFGFTLFCPVMQPDEQAPCIIYILHPQQKRRLQIEQNLSNAEIPVSAIVENGCAIAVLSADEVAADLPDGIRSGIFLETAEKRSPDSWGVISAWSWGASRVLDYLADCPHIDRTKIAVAGHSRGGKAALWAAASDRRFSACFSNCSGCTGAALSRGSSGESVRQINTTFPHWFSDNYKNYNGNENELPVDQHQLLALIAPRKLLVASASQDAWADPEGELLAAKLASDVYALYGKHRLEIGGKPRLDHLYGGSPAYYRSEGRHAITLGAWKAFLTVFTEEAE